MSLLESKDLSLWFATPRDFTESIEALSKVEELLACNRCGNSTENPVVLWSCDHVFCKDCVEDMNICAVCSLPSWPEDRMESKTTKEIAKLCKTIKGMLTDYMEKSKAHPKIIDTQSQTACASFDTTQHTTLDGPNLQSAAEPTTSMRNHVMDTGESNGGPEAGKSLTKPFTASSNGNTPEEMALISSDLIIGNSEADLTVQSSIRVHAGSKGRTVSANGKRRRGRSKKQPKAADTFDLTSKGTGDDKIACNAIPKTDDALSDDFNASPELIVIMKSKNLTLKQDSNSNEVHRMQADKSEEPTAILGAENLLEEGPSSLQCNGIQSKTSPQPPNEARNGVHVYADVKVVNAKSTGRKKKTKPSKRRTKVKYAPPLPFPEVADSELTLSGIITEENGVTDGKEAADEKGATGDKEVEIAVADKKEAPDDKRATEENEVSSEKGATGDKEALLEKEGDGAKDSPIKANGVDKKLTNGTTEVAVFATPPPKRKRSGNVESTPQSKLKRLSSPRVGVNKTPKTPASAKKNKKGETPLHIAAIKGNLANLKKAIAEGVDVNAKDNAGWTPLHEACNHGSVEVARLLIEAGASVNIPGFDNETPIMDALTNRHLGIVRLLLEHGADPYLRNINGKCAMSYAETDELKSLFLEYSKKETSKKPKLAEENIKDSPPEQINVSCSSSVNKSKLRTCSKILNATVNLDSAIKATHLVVGSHVDRRCPRTLKYMQAVARGAWIVQSDWLEACLLSDGWVNELNFEVVGSKEDLLEDGPKRSRLNRASQCPGIFSGYNFYLSGSYMPPSLPKDELAEILRLADGVMLTREPKPDSDSVQTCMRVPYHAHSDAPQYRYTHYIVYDSTQGKPSKKIRRGKVCTVPSSWVLDCISQFNLCEIPD